MEALVHIAVIPNISSRHFVASHIEIDTERISLHTSKPVSTSVFNGRFRLYDLPVHAFHVVFFALGEHVFDELFFEAIPAAAR